MNRKSTEKNLFPLILGIISVVALIAFLVLPVAYIDRGMAEGGFMGFISVFGGDVVIGSGNYALNYHFNPVNGWGIAIVCMLIVSGVLSFVLARYGRGFYYVSTVINVFNAILLFMYHSNWVYLNAPTLPNGVCLVGAGQIIAAVLVIVAALGNLVAAYQAKNSR